MHRIALYDLDKTITRRPTYTPFLLHAVRTHQPWRSLLLPFVGFSLLAYAAKIIDRARLKEWNHWLLLGDRVPIATVEALTANFADATMATNVLAKAKDRIAADRSEGCQLVLATASYGFYASEIAKRLGFDAVIATAAVIDDKGLRAQIDGENCYGAAKLRMIEAWLDQEGLARRDCAIRFYSDHASDVPTLAWSDEPFAVNAHPRLARLAAERNWPMLDWND